MKLFRHQVAQCRIVGLRNLASRCGRLFSPNLRLRGHLRIVLVAGFGDKQEVLQRNLVRLGVSLTDVSTTSFSIISVTYGAGGGSFRLAESNDGTPPTSLFYTATTLIGAASGPNEFYNGDIAEIRLYNTVLSDTDRAAIEEEIRKTYEN